MLIYIVLIYSTLIYSIHIGEALFYSCESMQGLAHLKESLRQNPDDLPTLSVLKRLGRTTAAMEAARQAVENRDFGSAVQQWTLALNLSLAPAASMLRAHFLSRYPLC